MRVLYALYCDRAQEVAHNRVNIEGIFHELFAPNFPAEHQMVFVISMEWESGEAGKQDFSINFLDPSGSPTGTISGGTEVHAARPGEPPPRTVLIMPLQRVVFPYEGTYSAEVEVGGSRVKELAPLHLIKDPTLHL